MLGTAAQPEAQESHQRYPDFRKLPDDQRGALAEAIGQIAGQSAEDGPWRVKKDRHQRDRVGLAHETLMNREEHRRGMDGLIVERGEELSNDEPDVRA